MSTNEILKFSETDTGTNLLTQAEYSTDSHRTIGNQAGIARSKLVNKVLKQSSLMSSSLAQFIADNQGSNVTDLLSETEISDMFKEAIFSHIKTVDGAGSGLDADLLDGQSSAYYAPIASPTFAGAPTAPTAPVGTDTTQIATTAFVKTAIATKIIPRPTKVNASSISVNGVILSLNTNLQGSSKTAGTDYYFTNTYITTDKNDSGVFGGFHYGVIPETFTAINNITASDATAIAGINAYSIWTHSFRPVCNPEGMVYILGRWYDIYLCNVDHHTYGTSAAGKTIAGGAVENGRNYPKIPLFYGGDGSVTYGTFTWFEAAEIAKAHSKDLISYNEFVAIAYGVLEASSASTADTGIAQHLANYTSKFGICMATGCQWIWGKDLHMRPDGTGLAWHTETEGRGSLYAYQYGPTAAVFGGVRDHTSYSGSRASNWNNYVWNSYWDIGCRFACDHLEVK